MIDNHAHYLELAREMAKRSRELYAKHRESKDSVTREKKMTLDELDRLAAEKIMGWVLYNGGGCSMEGTYKEGSEYRLNRDQWQPTRNIAQAWQCLEKFIPDFEITIESNREDSQDPSSPMKWQLLFRRHYFTDGFNGPVASTICEAIVRACLKAKK